MNSLKMRIKQGVAGFLAVCMMMPSFAGTAWADISLEEVKTEEHQVELDLSALEQGIQDAVNTNQLWNADKMKFNSSDSELITAYEQLFQDPDGTNPVYLVDYKFEDEALPFKSDMKIFVRTRSLEKELFEEEESIEDWEKRNGIERATASDATPADAEDERETESKTASSSDAEGYQITGKEEITILFKNSSNKNYLIRITMGGYQFKILDVPSASILIDEVRIDAPAENPAVPGGSGAPVESETPVQGEVPSETETQESLPEESSTEETSAIEETSIVEETSSPQETSEAMEETSVAVEETSVMEATTEEATEAVTEEATEEATETEPEEAGEAVVSISAHKVPRVAVPVAGDIDPADLDEDDENYEEYIEEDDLDEEYEGDYEEISARSVEEELGEVYAPVLYREKSSRLSRMAAQETTTASMVFSLGDVRAVERETPFNVTMYDYHSMVNIYTDKNFFFTNGYMHDAEFQQNQYWKTDTMPANITQGLVEPTFRGDDTNFIKFSPKNLFPKEQGSILSEGFLSPMRVYSKASVAPGFFEYDPSTGYYTFDSQTMGSNFDTTTQILDRNGEAGQFFPFGRDWNSEPNFHFGMHLSFDFSVLSDGKVNGNDMVFEFRGDDDTWVYLKEKGTDINRLALDIGGIHGSMSGKMNFASGEILYDSQYAPEEQERNATVIGRRHEGTTWKNYYANNTNDPFVEGANHQIATEKNSKAYLYTKEDAIAQFKTNNPGATQIQAETYVDNTYFQFMGFTREDLAEYTLDFYILERGAGKANCYLNFNIPTHKKDQIVVNKSVVSSNPDDKNKTYDYELWTGPGKENLQKTENFSLKPGTPWMSKHTYPPNYHFKVVEVGTGGAHEVNWKVGGGTGGTGTETGTFKIGTENTVLFTNVFEVSSTVGKKAIQQEGKPGQYDIELSVAGETVVDETGAEYHLQDIVATDVLSDHVEFAEDGRGYPVLTWYTKTGGTNVLTTADGKTYTSHNQDIATIVGKTITWNVTTGSETLKANETATLSFPVRVTGDTLTTYPDKGDAGTGTHADEMGYYSNDNMNSYVTAGSTAGIEINKYPFPKPVVRPVNFMSLILEKKVEGATTETKFPFTVTFENGGDKIAATDGEVVKNKDASFTVTGLGNGGTVKFTGIRPNASYTITESDVEDTYYSSACTQIETQDIQNDMPGNSVIDGNPAGKTVTGSMDTDKKVTFTNTLAPKTMDLTIVKNLEAADLEETTFVFKVENQDANSPGFGQVFYTSITVPAGAKTNSIVISGVPVSVQYQATEEEHMRYMQTNVTHMGKLDVTNSKVTFTNKKESDSYFSSTHVAVNEVQQGTDENFGFQETYPGRTPVEPTKNPQQLAAILPEDSQKRWDEEDSSDLNKTV